MGSEEVEVTYVVNEVLSSRSYILRMGGSIVLVDCGDFGKMLPLIGDLPVEALLLTHSHFDHIYGIPALMERYPDCTVYTNSFGKTSLADSRMNMSLYNEQPLQYCGKNVRIVSDCEMVALPGGVEATAYETPGHNPGCVCWRVSGYFFSGDAYIPGVKVLTTLPYCDRTLAGRSVERILSLSQGLELCPGHELLPIL